MSKKPPTTTATTTPSKEVDTSWMKESILISSVI